MADGFKKYFNGTTVNGRANVAKATYATLALFYLVYRVRRGKGAQGKDVLEDQCQCEGENTDSQAEEQCPVCGKQSQRCNDSDDPPSKPPPPAAPPAAGEAAASDQCPCDDPHVHIETPKQTAQRAPQLDQVHPAREIIERMQDAASRVLRSVIGAVIGGNAPNSTSSASMYEVKEHGASNGHPHATHTAAATATATAGASVTTAAETLSLESTDQLADENAGQQKVHKRRTAPRFCEPVDVDPDPAMSNEESHSHFRGFDDNFASEMFFEDFEE